MALLINLRQLERGPVVAKGKVSAEELELTDLDELIRLAGSVQYELEAAKMEKSVLVQGRVQLVLDCECARCLKPFKRELELVDWKCLLELEGEEPVPVAGDCVDLTPHIREDILLELPQRPLCQPDCRGLPKKAAGKLEKTPKTTGKSGQAGGVLPDWTVLNKLKL